MSQKAAIARNLNYIADLLESQELCLDKTPIQDAAREVATSYKGKPKLWGYNLYKLVFDQLESPRGTMPNNIKFLRVILSLEIHEKNLEEKNIYNPILVDKTPGINQNYNFSLEISGMTDTKKVISHWHLDYDTNGKYEYIHPDFHLTFGGNAMKSANDDENLVFGKVLIPPSPRIPHPPMDAILGIDFVLNNFVKNSVRKEITSDSIYKKAVKDSQHRLWRPYMLATSYHWCKFNCTSLQTEQQLCKRYYPFLLD